MNHHRPIFLHDGPYKTHIVRTRSLRETWWWAVTDQRNRARTKTGTATTEEYAKHDARKAVGALRAEMGEEAEAA